MHLRFVSLLFINRWRWRTSTSWITATLTPRSRWRRYTPVLICGCCLKTSSSTWQWCSQMRCLICIVSLIYSVVCEYNNVTWFLYRFVCVFFSLKITNHWHWYVSGVNFLICFISHLNQFFFLSLSLCHTCHFIIFIHTISTSFIVLLFHSLLKIHVSQIFSVTNCLHPPGLSLGTLWTFRIFLCSLVFLLGLCYCVY